VISHITWVLIFPLAVLAVEFVECLIILRRYSHGNCFNPSI
jgi:hypothetical protein